MAMPARNQKTMPIGEEALRMLLKRIQKLEAEVEKLKRATTT